MKNRIKEIRKKLNLTQQKFAEELKVSRNNIAGYEAGKNLSDTAISLICSKFNINEEWLRTGKGEMFNQEKNYSLDEFLRKRNATSLEIKFMKIYFSLEENIRKKIISDFKKAVLEEEFVNPQSSKNVSDEISVTEETTLQDETEEEIPPEYENMSVEEIEKQADFWDSLYEKRQEEIKSQKQEEDSKDMA